MTPSLSEIKPFTAPFFEYLLLISVSDQWQPMGGADLRRRRFLAEIYAKTKELGTVWGGGAPVALPLLDPPMNEYSCYFRPALSDNLPFVNFY